MVVASSIVRGRTSIADKLTAQVLPASYGAPGARPALEWSTDPADTGANAPRPAWVRVLDIPIEEGPEATNLQLAFEAPDVTKAPWNLTVFLRRIVVGSDGKPTQATIATPDYTAIDDRVWPIVRGSTSRRKLMRLSYGAQEYGKASVRLRVEIEHDGLAPITATIKIVKVDNPMQYAAGRMPPKDT